MEAKQLPLSANYSAALLKRFGELVDDVPPTIKAQIGDAKGPVIASNGYAGNTVFVTVTDAGSPTASGVGYVALEAVDNSGNVTSQGNVVPTPSAGSDLPNPFTHPFNGLTPDGKYQIHAIDGLGNHSYSTFTVVTTPPRLVVQSGQGTLPNGAVTTDNQISGAVTTPQPPAFGAPIGQINAFQVTGPGLGAVSLNSAAGLGTGVASFNQAFSAPSWYWIQACDQALNCVATSFCIDDAPPAASFCTAAGSSPGQPPSPPPGGSYPTQPATPTPPYSSPQPVPGQLPWTSPNPAVAKARQLGSGALAAHNAPAGPGYHIPGDPNSLHGPDGPVTPGQLMVYTLEFENVGDAPALGVYVTDTLDPALDDTTLSLNSMYSLVFSSGVPISTTAANFPFAYDPQTRTVTVLAGTANPSAGGSFVLQARLRADAAPGTVIKNQGNVYFPTALQQLTPTNIVVSAVPLPTQLAYSGASSGVFLSTAGLAAKLTTALRPAAQQLVNFSLPFASSATFTDATGLAAASLFLPATPASYNLAVNYAGDNFYYLPTAANVNFSLIKRASLLQTPFAAARPTDTVHLALTLTDDQGQALLRQAAEPKTIYLELLTSSNTATPLASSLLSGTSAAFQFSLPQPLQLSWSIRARFDGDSSYAGVISTGALRLIDDVPPAIKIVSPSGGGIISGSNQVTVSYSFTDESDLSPSATAYLVALDGSNLMTVANGAAVPASSLSPGSWTVVVTALDWAGNRSSATVAAFLVAPANLDTLPPRTSLVVGSPSFGTSPVYASSQTYFSLSAVDDQTTVGDGLGTVANTFYSVDGGTQTTYAAPFSITSEGLHSLSWFSVDTAGNAESPHTQSVAIDLTPPLTKLAFSSAPFVDASSRTFITGSNAVVFVATDPVSPANGSGVASGVAFTQYRVNQSSFVAYAAPFILREGIDRLDWQSQDNVQNLELLKSATIYVDATPPITQIVFSSPPYIDASTRTFISGGTSIGFAAADPVVSSVTSGVSLIEYRVDASSMTPFSTFVATFTLAEGIHTIDYRSRDKAGNIEATNTLVVRVDATAPISTLFVGLPQFALPGGTLLASAATPIVVASTDPFFSGVASGVKDSYIAIDSGAFQLASGPFYLTAPDGPRAIRFYSRDHVLNTEVANSTTAVLDSTPPVATLMSPSPGDGGVCMVFSGQVPVIGTVSDTHFQGYMLDFAPGANATYGFTLIAASTNAVSSGTLGVWNTAGLSGFQTLRLTATDLVDNVAVTTTTVFIGSPALLMSLQGRHGFNKPAGVAVDGAGNIYGADTNNDQIDVFTSTGGFVAILGHGDGQGPDKDDRTQGRLRLNKPKDVKVDGAGNVYIADTNDNRVVKVSLSGQLLLQIGRVHGKEHKDHDDDSDAQEMNQPGRGTGQFNKPSGLALDARGDIYVSDTNNHRVQIFAPDGSFVSAFNMPSVAQVQTSSDDDGDDPQSPATGQPFGIALDGAGNIYVADARGARALKFSPQGTLLQTYGSPGSGVGQFTRPEGIAVSADGDCLYVSDRGANRIQRFDIAGDATLIFGSSATFSAPVGLALDGAGSLYIADRNDNRIQVYGAPAVVPQPPKIIDVGSVISNLIHARDGGRIDRNDKAAVVIPAGALAQDMEVTISTPMARSDLEEQVKARKIGQDGLVSESAGVEYGPEGMTFQIPITIVLPYDPNALAARNVRESDLRVHYWNRDKEDWEALSSVVDTVNHTVSAQTTHFSLYQIFAPGTPQYVNAVNLPFQFVDLYAFPNPSRRGQAVTIRTQAGSADSVDLRIYDVSGRLVLATTLTSFQVMDDGNDKGAQVTFDHIWDVSSVGSGIYRYSVTAKKTGFPAIHRTGKVGVIR